MVYVKPTYEALEPISLSYLWGHRSRFGGAPILPHTPRLDPADNAALTSPGLSLGRPPLPGTLAYLTDSGAGAAGGSFHKALSLRPRLTSTVLDVHRREQ